VTPPDDIAAEVLAECRRIDRKFRIIGVVAMAAYLGIVLADRWWLHLSAETAFSLPVVVAYVGGIGWATMFLAPNMKRADISIRMGARTVSYISELHDEVKPIANDVRKAIGDVTGLIDRFKVEDYDKVRAKWDELLSDGSIDDIVKVIKLLPEKVDSLVRVLEQRGGGVPAAEAAAELRRRMSAADPADGGL